MYATGWPERQAGSAWRRAAGRETTGAIQPAISADGRFVAFNSLASNLVAGDSNNLCDNDFNDTYHENCDDLFVHDRQTGATTRVSVASSGAQANAESYFASMSADGRYVAFNSYASNLVFGDSNNFCYRGFDTVPNHNCVDAFVHDRQSGTTSRVSVNTAGGQGTADSTSAALSANGGMVAFDSAAPNLVAGDTNLCDVDLDFARRPVPGRLPA